MSFASDKLADVSAAYDAALKGERYRIADLELQRAPLEVIAKELDKWQRQVNAEQRAAAGDRGSLSVQVADFNHGRCGGGDRGEFGWH